MGSGVSIEREYRNIWIQRLFHWRRLPQRFGKWWWWMWLTMQLSGLPWVGHWFTWLAGLPLEPYRGRWSLARITRRPYISPKAQIGCPALRVDRNCFIDDFVTIVSGAESGSVILSEKVHIYRGTIIEVNRGAKVAIGAGTHIQAGCVLNGLVGDLRIGRDVMVGPHCGFFSYQHRTDDLSRPMCRQELTSKGDIVIEDDVWLGMGAKVMDGVRIGRGSVIGASAVVTNDIPPYSIALGVPACVVRKRGTEESRARMLESGG